MYSRIPRNFFLFWSGQDFQYVNYLCVLSLLKTNKVDTCTIYYEEAPINNSNWDELRKLEKVNVHRIDWDEFLNELKLNKENINLFFTKSRGKINQFSNLFRYLVLYKYGGVYIDFDTIFIKDFTSLLDTNFFVGFQLDINNITVMSTPGLNKSIINGAITGASKKCPISKFILDAMMLMSNKCDVLIWGSLGPLLLTTLLYPRSYFGQRVLYIVNYLDRANVSSDNLIKLIKLSSRFVKIENIRYRIYPKSFFYFYSWLEWRKIFEKNPLPKNAYLIHFWAACSSEFTRKIDESYIKSDDALYSQIAKRFIGN